MAQVMTMKKLDLGARCAGGGGLGRVAGAGVNRRTGCRAPRGRPALSRRPAVAHQARGRGSGGRACTRCWSGRRRPARPGARRHRPALIRSRRPARTGTARARSAGSPRVSTQWKVTLAGKSRARRVCVDPFHASRRAIVPGCGASGACAPGGRAGVRSRRSARRQATATERADDGAWCGSTGIGESGRSVRALHARVMPAG